MLHHGEILGAIDQVASYGSGFKLPIYDGLGSNPRIDEWWDGTIEETMYGASDRWIRELW